MYEVKFLISVTQGPEEEVRTRQGRRVRLPPAQIAVPQHDRGVLAAGKALLAGVRILADVSDMRRVISEYFRTSGLSLDMYAYLAGEPHQYSRTFDLSYTTTVYFRVRRAVLHAHISHNICRPNSPCC